MGKRKHDNSLDGRRTSRSLLAITLAASLAAFGCTTNFNPGNGTPTRSGPEVRTAPTSGVTSGGETATPVNPPMTSSYNRSEVLPPVTPRASGVSRSGVIRRSPDEAAAIMAGRQALHGRYLGVTNPGGSARGYQSDGIQTFVPPALQTNPQLTVNATISSDPFPAVTSGLEGGGATLDASGNATGGTTAAATINGTDVSPTVAATTVTPGSIAGTTTLPTIASSGTPSVTAASVGAARRGLTTGAARTTGTTAASTATTTTTTTPSVRTGTLGSPVRILRSTTGAVTVTNSGTTTSTTPATSSGRNQ